MSSYCLVAAAHSARYVTTAHTLDDQVETVLMRVLRGTGLAGLAGIPQARQLGPDVTLIRPLLGVRRRQIVAALNEIDQPWLSDSTNRDTKFTRNWLRHALLPQIRERLPHDADTSLAQLAAQAGAWHAWIGTLANQLAARHTTIETGPTMTIRIDVASLLNQQILAEPLPDILLTEVVRTLWSQARWPERDMTSGHWRQLVAALHDAGAGRFELPGGIRVDRDGPVLTLAR